MDTDIILKQVLHMRPSSFSQRERRRYRAEKMLMRQFILMKLQQQVPVYLHVKDMKNWLLDGRSFLEEFREVAKGTETRKLLMAELAWTQARHLCLNLMETELWEELEKERRLSQLLKRKVTLEGLQMFLSVIRPKAEQNVRTFLCHLSNKLLESFTDSHSSKRSKLALALKLQRTTAASAAQVVDTALGFLLDVSEPFVGVRNSSLACALRGRAEAAGAHAGKQLADAAASCFCLNTPSTRACLLRLCTSGAQDTVRAIYRRFVERSKTFQLMDFDESFITAAESVTQAVQDMDNSVWIYNWTLRQFEKSLKAPDVFSVAAAEKTDDKNDKEGQ